VWCQAADQACLIHTEASARCRRNIENPKTVSNGFFTNLSASVKPLETVAEIESENLPHRAKATV
jgi:hypothetical protein